MSLLEDLRGLDVTGIEGARASVSAAVKTDDLAALQQNGNSAAVLGELGRGLESLKSSFPDPESLLRPLVDALGNLVPQLDASHLPLGEYTTAVRDGATFAGKILGGFSEHPAEWGKAFGSSFGDALQVVGGKANEISKQLGGPADVFADFTTLLEQPPASATAVAELALGVLMPFPQRTLASLRDGTKTLVDAAGRITLPSGRTAGLIAAFDVVALSAAKGDAVQIQAALRELERARLQTVATLQDDLRFVGEQMARLKVPQVLNPLAEASLGIRAGRDGVVEFMRDFGRELAEIHFHIEHLDVDRIRAFLRDLPGQVEAQARAGVESVVDQLVARTKQALRDLFTRIPVREYRAIVTRFLHEVAQRIDDANLDEPAKAARGALADASQFLTSQGLAADVQAEMQRLNLVLQDVLDKVEAPIEQIAAEVDALAGDAVQVLERAADALVAFQAAIDEVHTAIDNLALHEREQQIVDSLQKLRTKAENLLRTAPLPDSLKPQVEQMVETLRSIDFDELMQPVLEVAEQIKIPPEVSETVEAGLADAKRVIDNLIPQQLIDSINAEVEQALASIRGFDPAGLVPDLSSYLDEAASAVETLDPRGIAESIRGPYQSILDVIDRAHPVKLLQPVIEVYDSLLASLPAPNPVTTAQRLGDALDSAGRVAGRALVEPVGRLTPDAQPEVGDPASPRPIEIPPDLADIRPGDAIRLLGYLPGRLREILKALEASVLGDVMREVDSYCAGLARQLRAVPAAMADVERRVDRELTHTLSAVAAAQARAQLSLHAHVSTGDLTLHLTAVAAAGPARLQADLAPAIASTRQILRGSGHDAAGRVRAAFERTAEALESSPLASLTGNVDDLLAVLDPEPLANAMDLIVNTLIEKVGPLITDIADDLQNAITRLKAIVNEFNPMALAQRFLTVLDVLREEVDVLNPRRLAIELAEVHGAIRETIAAYDPRLIAEDLFELSRDVAQQIRALDPKLLLGNLDFWKEAVDRAAALNPAKKLEAVGAALRPVGERLAAIDLDALIESVNELPPVLVEEFKALIDATRNEIVALLESLRFATADACASASVSVG